MTFSLWSFKLLLLLLLLPLSNALQRLDLAERVIDNNKNQNNNNNKRKGASRRTIFARRVSAMVRYFSMVRSRLRSWPKTHTHTHSLAREEGPNGRHALSRMFVSARLIAQSYKRVIYDLFNLRQHTAPKASANEENLSRAIVRLCLFVCKWIGSLGHSHVVGRRAPVRAKDQNIRFMRRQDKDPTSPALVCWDYLLLRPLQIAQQTNSSNSFRETHTLEASASYCEWRRHPVDPRWKQSARPKT